MGLLGDSTKIGVSLYLGNLFETVTLTVKKYSNNKDTVIIFKTDAKFNDTLWSTFSFVIPDEYVVTVAAVLNDGKLLSEIADIIIASKIVTAQILPATQTKTPGSNVTYSVSASGDAPFSYQWIHEQNILQGDTGVSLSLPNVSITDSGSYTCIVKDKWGDSVVTPEVFLYVNASQPTTLSALITPQTASLCIDSTVTFVATATGDAPFTYAWFHGSTEMVGQIKDSLTIDKAAAADSGVYSCLVKDKNSDTVRTPLAHLAVTLKVNTKPALSLISGHTKILPTETCTLSFAAKDPDAGQVMKYAVIKKPQGATGDESTVIWLPHADFLGDDTVKAEQVIVVVTDNGEPVMSDTLKTTIEVRKTIPVPSAVQTLSAISRVGGIYTFKWSRATNADQYKIYRSKDTVTFAVRNRATDTVFTDTIKDTSYYYYVVAANSTFDAAPSPKIFTQATNAVPQFTANMPKSSYTILEGDKLTFVVKASDPNKDSTTVTIKSTTLKRPSTAKITNDTISWVSAAGDSGIYEIVLKANDKSDSTLTTVTVNVTKTGLQNSAPAWDHDTLKFEILENDSIKVNFADSVSDENGDPITFAITSGDTLKNKLNGSTWINKTTFTDSGSQVIKIAASDGKAESVLTIVLHVKNVNRPPQFVVNMPGVSYNVGENQLLAFAVKAIDPDNDNSAITIKSTTLKHASDAAITGDTLKWKANYGDKGTYNIVFKAKDQSDSTTKEVTVNVVTTLLVPSAPVLVSPNDLVSGLPVTVGLVWNKAAYATNYHVQVSDVSTFGDASIIVQDSMLTDTTKTIDGLTNGKKYYWRVRAKNAAGTSAFSSGVSFTTLVQFKLNINVQNGTVNRDKAGPLYDSGTVVTLTPVPSGVDYEFKGWTLDTIGNANPLTVTLNKEKNLTATFAKKTFKITVTQGTNGTITPAVDSLVPYNGSVIYTITPTAGYEINEVKVDGSTVTVSKTGDVGSYTIPNVIATHTITATFARKTFKITVTQGTNGIITPAVDSFVPYNGSVVYAITPTAGYEINEVKVDGSTVAVSKTGDVGSYTIPNVIATHTITATFKIKTFTITATAGSGGSISPTGSATISHNATPTYTITPNSDYNVASVTVDGVSVGAVTSYQFTSVTANHTIAATFSIKRYTLTVTSNPSNGGSISPASGAYNVGTKVKLAITQYSGYLFSGFGGADGSDVSTSDSSIIMSKNRVITVDFGVSALVIYNGNGHENGGTNPAPAQVLILAGTNINIPGNPGMTKAGCVFSGWNTAKNGLGLDYSGSRTITSDVTLYAKWTVSDVEGNIYNTVDIGNFTWLVQNLKTTKLRDGTDIPINKTASNTACCYYDDYINYKEEYGMLYNGNAISEVIAPAGWHIPTWDEWNTLLAGALGGLGQAGRVMKEPGTNHWFNDNGNNFSGFTARGAGYCSGTGSFTGMKSWGVWWTNSGTSSPGARCPTLFTAELKSESDSLIQGSVTTPECGSNGFYSIRCIRDH
jgi:uncharacterized protein (TIGR02145 family)